MTAPPTDGDAAFADLLDELLDELLNGTDPDFEAAAARHPAAGHRVDEAYRLACGVAGRRVTTEPSLEGYHILRELGRGGMGTVYLARQEQLDREVALKVLPHTFGLSAYSRARFLEEARALARVHHEHIVGIHRIVDNGDLLAFEMEYVDGPSLQAVLTHLREVRERTGEPPTLEHVAELLQLPTAVLGAQSLTQFFVRLGLCIARALGAVHAAGFVHRDVKPANILLHKDGKPVLADFGLVRDTALERSHKTGFAGTPVYSSPEQLRGNAPVGAQTDVYALAVTLYECLTLSPPFHGRTTTDMLFRIESGRVPPLRQKAPQAPRDLETIISHAMELEPERRYASGTELAGDLQRLLDLQPIRARPVSVVRRLTKFVRRNRMSILAASLGALLVAAAMWPLLGQAHAAERAREAAREHITAARQALLSPTGNRAGLGQALSGTRATLQTTDNNAPDTIQRAIDEYRRALEQWPDHPVAGRELAVARMLQWQRRLTLVHADSLHQAMATEEYQKLAADLPPLTRAAAELAASGKQWPTNLEAELAAASADDRASLGLLSFLLGERGWSELAWSSLAPDAPGQPLRDAVLGLLHLADGAPEFAYVRLQAAQQGLPDATFALELADAALAMGETQLAEQWFARAPQVNERKNQRRRVAADLEVACGNSTAAAAIYHELIESDFLDPTPRYRLAQLAMRDGELRAAADRLDDLIERWPGVPRFHLDRARVALQGRDVATYLQQVLTCILIDPAEQSSGGVADLLEVLRIGGLHQLHRDMMATVRGHRSGRTFLGGEMPLRSMLPLPVAERIEVLLPLLAELRRAVHDALGEESGIDGAARHLLVTAPLALDRLPALAAIVSPLPRAACRFLPWLALRTYPRLQVYGRMLLAQASLSSWSIVDMKLVLPPAELSDVHVFGCALVRGPDWNHDGIDDLLIGCEAIDPTKAKGHVLIVDGRTAETIATVTGQPTHHMFGHSLAVIGDVDGDQVTDWLVGAPAGSPTAKDGYVELRSGRDQSLIARVTEDAAAFGVDVAGLGDIDADGCPDFAVAVPPFVRNSTPQGRVVLFSGRTRKPLRVLKNDQAGTWFGGSIADAGDTDGDGVHDLIVGGNFGSAPGNVRLFSGRTGEVLHSWQDESTTSSFGCLVTGPGDLDGDGHGDVCVSAIRQSESSGVDQVFVYSGRTGRPIASFQGGRPGIRFGATVARYELPGGRPLLAIGAPLGGSGASGAVDIWTLDGQPVTSVHGPGSFSSFGGLIALTNDTDGDGRPELFVASPRQGRQGNVSRVDSATLRFPR